MGVACTRRNRDYRLTLLMFLRTFTLVKNNLQKNCSLSANIRQVSVSNNFPKQTTARINHFWQYLQELRNGQNKLMIMIKINTFILI